MGVLQIAEIENIKVMTHMGTIKDFLMYIHNACLSLHCVVFWRVHRRPITAYCSRADAVGWGAQGQREKTIKNEMIYIDLAGV